MIVDKYVYTFSSDNRPILEIEKGSTVVFKTKDCFSNQIESEEQLISHIDYSTLNPATGPVYIKGAEIGDIIAVEIVDIHVSNQGVTTTLPETGPLGNGIEPKTKLIKIQDGKAIFNDIVFPIKPMIGVIGLAPKAGSIPTGFPGSHGGNLDCKLITKGTRIYLPVQIPGGLLQIGDLHGVMGDGEICGTGLEVSGEVKTKIDVIKKFHIEWPILETADRWYVISSGNNYELALRNAAETMEKLLVNGWGWNKTDVYLYMSLQGDVEICQGCKPCSVDMVLRLGIPKSLEKKRLVP